jgi:tetratricopeptide (TPR) repeat protein/flagellar motor protein MotB
MNPNRLWFVVFALWVCPYLMNAQIPKGGSTTDFMQAAEEALLAHNYEAAIKWYERALQYQPNNNVARRNAGICHELLGQYEAALQYYESVISSDSRFSRALFYQTGVVHYKLSNYHEALAYFEAFENLQDTALHRFHFAASQEAEEEQEYLRKLPQSVRACQVSIDSAQLVNITEVVNMGTAINTKADEYFPYLSNDRQRLFFTRLKSQDDDEDLHLSLQIDGRWQGSSTVRSFNSKKDEGMITMVRDGRTLFFTACNREGVYGPCDIWQAQIAGTEVSNVAALKGYSNSEKWESQACTSCDGSTLFFASNREGGFGGTDIWYSTRLDDGIWSKPINLGPKINTPEDEEAPFITNDGKTLYFSSTGHLGMGEQDIFVSWLDIKGEWSTPMNLGPPVNSAFRELGLFLSADGKTGFFSSNRTNGQGGMDIYTFELSDKLYSDPVTYVEIFVLDKVLRTPEPATVQFKNRGRIPTDDKGRIFLCVGADETLIMDVEKEGYHPLHAEFPIPIWENKEFYRIELLLRPTFSFLEPEPEEEGDSSVIARPKVVLENYQHTIYFGFDDAKIAPGEIDALDQFVAPIQDQDIERVDIVGYADDIGKATYNIKLSEDRAKQIALFLMERGIVVNQIYLEGKGELKDDSPKDRNRRVEVKIVVRKEE